MNMTTKPNKNNLSWSKTLEYLDNNIIGDEKMITDERWYDENLDSDVEVRKAIRKKLEDAKSDNSEITRTIKLLSSTIERPLTRRSPRLQFSHQTLAAQETKSSYKACKRPYQKEPL